MKSLIKRLMRWDQKTAFDKSVVRYRYLYLIATLICWLPIPIRHLLYWSGSDKHRPQWHSYGWTYQELFRPLKYRRIKLLEIGIGDNEKDVAGRSLVVWRAFFPRGTIVGFDLQDKDLLARGRIKIYRGDQSFAADLAQLQKNEGPFDIIIDDGSHLNQHQLFSFGCLFHALREKGLYVIEDVHTSFWPERIGGVLWDGAHPNDAKFSA
ncbi:MAG: hypothetical protein P4L87_26790 [Formivibrio sp.]|nr:hypothetical protein [Formivibrio sp.]